MLWYDIPVQIYPDLYVRGVSQPSDPVTLLRVEKLGDALKIRWDTAALFSMYVVEKGGALSDQQARVNKPLLTSLRAKGGDVTSRFVAFDFDLPHPKGQKTAWTKDWWDKVRDAWIAAVDKHAVIGRQAVWYSTNGGFRALYLLPGPTSADRIETVLRGMIALFQQTALADYIDPACADWTRLFRFPRVRRERGFTDEQPFFSIHLVEDATPLLPEELPQAMIDGSRIYGEIKRISRSGRPSPEDAKALLYAPPRNLPTDWLRAAAHSLRGRDVYDYINGDKKLEDGGGRNVTLMKQIGSACALLMNVPETTPAKIYALFVDPCEQMQARTGDDSGKDWLDVAWEMVCRTWEKEAAQRAPHEAAVVAAEAVEGRLSDIVLAGMRSWCKHPFLHGSDAEGLKFVQEHAIVSFGSGNYHLLRSDGFYDPLPVTLVNIPARVRELGMTAVIPLEEEQTTGREVRMRKIPPNELLAKHATLVARRIGVAGARGCYISGIETDAASFAFKMYERRRDLPAQYSPDVDAWLKALAGDRHAELCRWIGWALAFEDGPICALSLNGPPGVGKKLLVEGLAECVDTGLWADARELTGRFQSVILHTPFLVVNEGLPRIGRDAPSDPADAFRRMISGDSIHVEEKGMGIIVIRNPMRVVITANNDDVLRHLYAHRDLSADDRVALATRLLHFDVDDAAAKWLRKQGGLDFTSRAGSRWIRGDDGAASDNVVARHFLWLYANRPARKAGSRLVVEGAADAALVREMSIGSGAAPEIIETVLSMIEQQTPPPGFVIEEAQVYVTSAGVRDHHAALAHVKGLSERLNLKRIAGVLRGLSVKDWHPAPIGRDEEDTKLRWWMLDLDLLADSAHRFGTRAPKLSKLLAARAARRHDAARRA